MQLDKGLTQVTPCFMLWFSLICHYRRCWGTGQECSFASSVCCFLGNKISWFLMEHEQTEACMRAIMRMHVQKNAWLECLRLFLTHHAIILCTMGPSGADSCAGNGSDVKHEQEEWCWMSVCACVCMCVCGRMWNKCLFVCLFSTIHIQMCVALWVLQCCLCDKRFAAWNFFFAEVHLE